MLFVKEKPLLNERYYFNQVHNSFGRYCEMNISRIWVLELRIGRTSDLTALLCSFAISSVGFCNNFILLNSDWSIVVWLNSYLLVARGS